MDGLLQEDSLSWRDIKSLSKEDWLREEECLTDMEYLSCVHDILRNETFQSMRNFIQHGCTTTLTHCIHVSYYSYRMCKRFGLNYEAAARAGLLHDLFLYDWHEYCKETGERLHGFYHPRRALDNAVREFVLTDLEKDIILKHMWPMTVVPPKSREGFVVMYVDKICGLKETIFRLKREKTTFSRT